MSNVTFVIIKDGTACYVACHYSCITQLLQGKVSPEEFIKLNMSVDEEGHLQDWTDTGFIPCVIVNMDTKTLINTSYNWFDNFEQYLNKNWKFEEFNPV